MSHCHSTHGLSSVVQFLRHGSEDRDDVCARARVPHGHHARIATPHFAGYLFPRRQPISGRRTDMVPRPLAAYFRSPRYHSWG